ncbi:hypothetical protein ACIPYQ_37695 [Streptomyces sp. NPDC090045]|uniref:hypothetical protein n=1 Tax=Streptomyces sp. NPDC090045 TaxID=3365927 RepID=UPI003818D37A
MLPKDSDLVEALWNSQRDKEWKKTDDGVFMAKQAIDFYKKFYPPGAYDAFVAMVRHALTDKYADMAGLPRSVLDTAAKPIAAGNDVISGIGGGLLAGGAKKATGVNPYKENVGIASKGFNEIQKFALTHEQDDQPQMHQELGDSR